MGSDAQKSEVAQPCKCIFIDSLDIVVIQVPKVKISISKQFHFETELQHTVLAVW